MGARARVLILGIGNILMGDEGVGVHVARFLEERGVPDGVACLDGGTGSFQLLEPLLAASRAILVDATSDGAPAGTFRRLRPRFAGDFPRSLTAHDIGLKDLLDAFYLIGDRPDITLFAVSIETPGRLGLELSDEIAAVVPVLADAVMAEALTGDGER